MTALLPPTLPARGTHALVIGVSRYRHMGDGLSPTKLGRDLRLRQLTCAARSASNVAGWLLTGYHREGLPLASLEVLFSPSEGEALHPEVQAKLDALAPNPADYAATRANAEVALKAFLKRCLADTGSVAIVYVAGHGVQFTKQGATLLLEDIGDEDGLNELHGALDFTSIHLGMNHPKAPHQQFWFFDGCRQKPQVAQRFERMTGALELSEQVGHVKDASALFLASSTREESLARPGQGSLFSEALLWAVQGGAAKGPCDKCPRWHVSVNTLNEKLRDRVRAEASKHEEQQNVEAAVGGEAVFHEMLATPKVPVRVGLIPAAAAPHCSASLRRGGSVEVLEHPKRWPIDQLVEAGLYLLKVSAEAQYRSVDLIVSAEPPQYSKPVDVTP